MKTILVGCGSISIQELKGLTAHPDVQIASLIDLRIENAEARRSEFDLADAEVSTSFEAMLEKHRPDIVVDCTIPAAHSEITQKAIAAGAHVLGQKPMADSLENARRAVEAARASDRTYGVIQTMRFSPTAWALRDFLASGALGAITTVDGRFFVDMHFPADDFRNTMEHVLILDMAIHAFDFTRFITGTDAETALCREWNPKGSWYQQDAAAFAYFALANSARFVYHGSWASEGCGGSGWRVICENGTIVAEGGSIRAEQVVGRGTFRSTVEAVEVSVPELADTQTGHIGAVHDFVNAVRDGREPLCPCEDNFKSLAMVHAAIASSETGKETNVETL